MWERSDMPQLTATRVKNVTKPGKYGDGDGLYLNVTASGSKSWVQRIVVHGRRRDIGLGGFPAVGLAQARSLTASNRTAVAEGRDPVAEKRKPSVPTFREAARQTHQANLPRWRNQKHGVSWMQTLERHAFPVLGNLRVDQIDKTDVLEVLTPIWGSRQETARRVRQRIRTVMRWAMAHGFIQTNPAGEVIDGALPPMPKLEDNLRALPYQEVSDGLATIDASGASIAAKLCLRFVVLTAARSGEARGALWREIKVKEALWTVPGDRMKGGKEHRVPLSDAALTVLGQAQKLRDGSDLVFPSPTRPGYPLSDMTLTKVLRGVGLADRATVHGFRSAFRDWAAECTSASEAAIELSLAHRDGNKVKRAYARSDLLGRRRPLMDTWAQYLCNSHAGINSMPNNNVDKRRDEHFYRGFADHLLKKGDGLGLANSALWWELTSPEESCEAPTNDDDRDVLLRTYSKLSSHDVWAWEGMRQLLVELLRRDEPIPLVLQSWAYEVAANSSPPCRRDRPAEEERNATILVVINALRELGCTSEIAMEIVGDVLCISYETVRSAVQNSGPNDTTLQIVGLIEKP